MTLYKEDSQLFLALVDQTGEFNGRAREEIIKDYFLTEVLKNIQEINANIVFKGGTSLTKALHILDRFSEDIDFSYTEEAFNEMGGNARNKSVRDTVNAGIEKSGLVVSNSGQQRSRAKYNSWSIEYPHDESLAHLRTELKVETYMFTAAFPSELAIVQSMIGEYVEATLSNKETIYTRYPELAQFKSKIQSPERTLIDKVLAVADAYEQKRGIQMKLEKNLTRSRDIYDIVKIVEYLDGHNYHWEKLPVEVKKIRKELAPIMTNITSQPGENPWQSFVEALNGSDMLTDWNVATARLLNSNESKEFGYYLEQMKTMVTPRIEQAFNTEME